MATRSSARLAALSPPPTFHPPPTMSDSKNNSSKRPAVSTTEWTQKTLQEYNISITPASDLPSLMPQDYTTDELRGPSQLHLKADSAGSMRIPEIFFAETDDGIRLESDDLPREEDSQGDVVMQQQQDDLLVRGFFDTLRMIQSMSLGGAEEGYRERHVGLEEYPRQLLYDFVRVLFLANKSVLGKSDMGRVQISPSCRMNFAIAGTEYIVLNDGCVVISPARKNNTVPGRSIPISFEARQYHLTDDENTQEEKIPGQVLAQLFGSVLDSRSPEKEQEAFVLHIQKTKIYVYHGKFSPSYLSQLLDGNELTESATIQRYPLQGFDLSDTKQRKDLCRAMFSIFKYCISSPISPNLQDSRTPRTKCPKAVVVINGPAFEGERYLDLLAQNSQGSTPRSASPRRGRSASPKRQGSPKRKLNAEEEDVNASPRPTKRTATEESKTPIMDETKPVKLNSFGFGAKNTGSPWAVPAAPTAPTGSPAKTSENAPPVKKTFGGFGGFGAASKQESPFAAVAQSSSAWSGWDNQKSATFEKKSLFSSFKPAPPKKEDTTEKKPEEDASEDEASDDEKDSENSAEDLESQLENGDDSDKSKKNIDMREQAGEAHEETLYEATCTLYETDPTTASWVSKGTGMIHVNVDKDSLDEPSPRNSRLIMRQQGTMKVMWNVRLFKGMQLLPRQVSEGDRRMDVYVKMVLVDNGQPKTYALKLRNHTIMDQLYSAIKRAIPT